MAGLHTSSDTHAGAAPARIQQLTHRSSMRENVLMHLLLGELGCELATRGIDYDELHSKVDHEGFDVLLEAGGVARHMQVKAKVLGGARSSVTINTRLAAKPSGCVVWLTFDPHGRRFCDIRWFGGAPGAPLPDAGSKIARHTRANSKGVKSERSQHRVLPFSRFERLDDMGHLADRLFGLQPEAPLAFLRSRLQANDHGPVWLSDVASGHFGAIPAHVSWERGGSELATLVDGYRLLALISDADANTFLERQRTAHREVEQWQGDAITLWATLFLEVRADRFGEGDFTPSFEHLDALVQQLRSALIALESAGG